MSVIILDGHLKSALAAVRSLRAQHVEVTAGCIRNTGMALWSSGMTERFVYPDPKINQAAFVKALKREAKACGTLPVVLAFSDATHQTLQQCRAELEGVILFNWADEDAFSIAFNKAATYSEAKLLGVAVIPTWLLENSEEIKRRSSEFMFPMVVKPRQSIVWKESVGVSGTAVFAHSVEQVQQLFRDIQTATGESPLLQPLIVGEEYGVELLAETGRVVAQTVHHRLRSMSPTGGASVLKETIREGTEVELMETAARKLVRALNWTGPIMVEFKIEADTRTPLLMEINGRFWGSLPLAVAAGVDFPYLAYQQLTGDLDEPALIEAREGVITRHWLGDLRNLLRVLFLRDAMRPVLYPSRRLALRDFFTVPAGTQSDVWSWRDPKPFFMELIDVIKTKL